MKLLSVYDLGQFNVNRREWRRGKRRGLWRRRKGGTATANQAGQDWEADQSKRMDQSKRTGNKILCLTILSKYCGHQELFHTIFIPFVCPELCCSLLFHLLTHPFGKTSLGNSLYSIRVFRSSCGFFSLCRSFATSTSSNAFAA